MGRLIRFHFHFKGPDCVAFRVSNVAPGYINAVDNIGNNKHTAMLYAFNCHSTGLECYDYYCLFHIPFSKNSGLDRSGRSIAGKIPGLLAQS